MGRGGPAGAKTVDGVALTPIVGFTVLSTLGAIGWARLERETARATATAAAVAVLTAGYISFGSSLAANVWFDRSPATDIEADVIKVTTESTTAKKPSSVVVVRSGTEQFSFPQDLAPDCVKGLHATVRMRAGALGHRWVESAL